MRGSRRFHLPPWLAGLMIAGTVVAVSEIERRYRGPQRRSIHIGGAPDPKRVRVKRPLWKAVLLGTYDEINDDRLLALAAAIVFFGLLALFPAITAFVSSYGLFAKASSISEHLSLIAGFVPGSAFKIIEEQVLRVVSTSNGKLSFAFMFGLGLAIWSANAGIKAMIDALNIIYDAKETRSFIWLNVVSLAFTVGAIVALLLAFGAVAGVPLVLAYLGWTFNVSFLPLLRWPALLLMLVLALEILYRFGPNRFAARWRWVTPGSFFAALAWIIGSGLLSWYLADFANYDATYGSLGAGIGLMMWLWMTFIVVLVGAELNSVLDALTPPVKEKRVRTTVS